ncbi:ARC1 [Cyberlindnera jadinii]|uniref:ARC1 protein n=1 Tax=Cyberlindnera jadinii (strain ATCC 18201 / CBS 1600 / BCRC 20928 / JCM 3617 / NBRC 0987 / NRRL Y-1542) TaxID=983966 RepID=A0A0H5CC15_CYBJN|nr:nucleic acid-binding protein [Cyberlindnera jadinii NRRL Y-1542]ODV72813.1 nucleic acid-binding protein [Cyberlindnera jadinii NRRL Y-1542]CEP22169.1 ARC1 [Cyberlindnera jadinii]
MSDLTAKFQKLSLSSLESPTTQFGELSDEQNALQSQWLTLSKRFPETFKEFNENLKSKTYLLGNAPSEADVVAFGRALPLLKKFESKDYAANRHVIRWADLIQNTLVDVPDSEKVVVDFSVELPREIKEKPKKESKEAAAPKEASKEAKKEKSKKDDKPRGKPDEETLKKLREEAAKAKKEKKAKAQADQQKKAAEVVPPNPGMIDFRVGFIQKAIKHPDADSLYVSTIECGDEEGPRTVCSGLVKHFPLEALQERYVVVVANLKPVNMRGVKSTAMVLCGSDDEHVEFVEPPAGSKAGDKVFFEGFDSTPEKQLNPKKKIWEQVQPGFSTNDQLEVIFKQEGKPDAKLTNKNGDIFKVASITNANVR